MLIPPSIFADLKGNIEDFKLSYCIIVSDWNLTLDQNFDPHSRRVVADSMLNHDLFDVWWNLHPNDCKFTCCPVVRRFLSSKAIWTFLISSGHMNAITASCASKLIL